MGHPPFDSETRPGRTLLNSPPKAEIDFPKHEPGKVPGEPAVGRQESVGHLRHDLSDGTGRPTPTPSRCPPLVNSNQVQRLLTSPQVLKAFPQKFKWMANACPCGCAIPTRGAPAPPIDLPAFRLPLGAPTCIVRPRRRTELDE